MKKLYILFFLVTLCFVSCERQDVFDPDLALNNSTIRVSKEEFTSKVIVFSNTEWTVRLTNSDAQWITLVDGEDPVDEFTGKGREYFYFKVQYNDTGADRSAEISVSTASTTKKVVVVQQK